jgi:hypothetical protein
MVTEEDRNYFHVRGADPSIANKKGLKVQGPADEMVGRGKGRGMGHVGLSHQIMPSSGATFKN